MSLIDLIHKDDLSRVLLISDQKQYTINDLSKQQKSHVSFLKYLNGKNVALDIKNSLSLSQWLLLLDGIANKILILPPNTDNETKSHFIELSKTAVCLSDYKNGVEQIDRYDLSDLPKNNENKDPHLITKQTEWILTTSGTTGTPKLVRHTLESLTRATKKSDLSSPSPYRWGLLYGLQRFAGLQVFLQAILGESSLVLTQQEQELSDKLSAFIAHEVNCLSATPTLWRKILMQPEAAKLSLESITLGGEIADDGILKAIHKQYPKAKIRHIYASTEAGTGFSVTDGQAGFPLFYLDKNDSDVLLKISDHNTLLIQSKARSKGYIGDHQLDIDDGYIDTGDIISIKEGRCYFEGRENGAINVGGNKVQPEHIEHVLLNYPNIVMASVTAKKNPIMGNLVHASIVVDQKIDNEKEFINAVRQYCHQQLEKFMVPAFIKIVDDIETNNTGKVVRA